MPITLFQPLLKKTTTTTKAQATTNNNENNCFSYPAYPCCKGNVVVYTDNDGSWGVENGDWCGISAANAATATNCWSQKLGYKCCNGCNVVTTDESGKWGVENNEWCGITC